MSTAFNAAAQKLAFGLAIDAVKELRALPKEEAENLLESCWASHFRAFQRVHKAAPPGVYSGQDPVKFFAELSAHIVMDNYFRCRGNWSEMIERLEMLQKEIT